jgi:hypothetical protein
VAILNHRGWGVLEGGTSDGLPVEFEASAVDPLIRVGGAGNSDVVVCIGGHVELNSAGEALLVAALPPIGHCRRAGYGRSPTNASVPPYSRCTPSPEDPGG